MASTQNGSSDVSPVYRRCTKKFQRHYQPVLNALATYNTGIDRNWEVAQILRHIGDIPIAKHIEQCHRTMVAYDECSFKPAKYCRKYLYCSHCSKLRSAQLADQIMEASVRFSRRVDSHKLMLHQFIINPDTNGRSDSPHYDYMNAFAMLLTFRKRLQVQHQLRDGHRLTKITGKAKLGIWGPTYNALHIVPANAGRNIDPYVHMHLTITTSFRSAKRLVTSAVKDIWEDVKKHHGVTYRTENEEVKRRVRESKYKDEDDNEDDIRFGGFSPVTEDADCKNLDKAIRHMKYLSHGVKDRWEPSHVVKQVDMLEAMDLGYRDTRQLLGKEGATVAHMPNEFSPERLRPRYQAKYTGTNLWEVLEKCD